MGWRSKPPTVRQLAYIKAIEEESGVIFAGATRGEAYDYISNHADSPGLDKKETDLYWSNDAIFESM